MALCESWTRIINGRAMLDSAVTTATLCINIFRRGELWCYCRELLFQLLMVRLSFEESLVTINYQIQSINL